MDINGCFKVVLQKFSYVTMPVRVRARPARGYCHIPMEMRHSIVLSVLNDGNSAAQVARLFGVPDSTVRSILARFEKTGLWEKGKKTSAPVNKKNRPTILNWVTKRLDENPSVAIEDLCKSVNENFQVDVAPTTVHRWVNSELQYRLKLLRYEVHDNNSPERIASRKAWCEMFLANGGNLTDCVHVDEAGFNLHLTRRLGRAAIGIRPRQKRPTQRGQNLTLIVAVTREGLLVARIHWRSFKAENFNSFILNDLFPLLERPRTIIIDNCRIHKAKVLKDALALSPNNLEFLPAYTPYFDCAEWVFGSVKPYIKKQEFLNASNLEQHIVAGLHRISATHAAGWMQEVNHNF